MAIFTPGPWRFLEDGCEDDLTNAFKPLTICGPNHDDLANICSSDDATVSITREEAIGNARMIAAAPDLVATLIEAERFIAYFVEDRTMFVGGGTPTSCLAQIRAALAKAGAAP